MTAPTSDAPAPESPEAQASAAGGPEASATTVRVRLELPLIHVVAGLVALIWVVLDQATKALAVETLSGGRIIDLGFLDLRLIRNPGGAFGFPGFPGLFVVVAAVVVILVVRALPRTDRLSLAVAYGLITGGATGNVIDRLVRSPGFGTGHVIDFFDLRWWPVFNVADAGIVVGAALIAVLATLADRRERAAAEAQPRQPPTRPGSRPRPWAAPAEQSSARPWPWAASSRSGRRPTAPS
ncbi:MAG: signal peptidase II, partial [Actinomycetota bacterium]|nr:signal peptidase II [Actinomycetota bacterium]